MSHTSTEADWALARSMPSLNEDVKVLTAVPFNRENFIRLGLLHAKARSLGW